jgi:hypothetical protein
VSTAKLSSREPFSRDSSAEALVRESLHRAFGDMRLVKMPRTQSAFDATTAQPSCCRSISSRRIASAASREDARSVFRPRLARMSLGSFDRPTADAANLKETQSTLAHAISHREPSFIAFATHRHHRRR